MKSVVKRFSVILDEDTAKRPAAAAKSKRMSQAALIRQACKSYLAGDAMGRINMKRLATLAEFNQRP